MNARAAKKLWADRKKGVKLDCPHKPQVIVAVLEAAAHEAIRETDEPRGVGTILGRSPIVAC